MSYLKDNAEKILASIKRHKPWLDYNAKIQLAAEGDMLSIMHEVFEGYDLPQNKFDAKRFCVSFNYLEHVVKKRSQVFTFKPELKASSDQELVQYLYDKGGINDTLQSSNKYANSSKSTLLQAYQKMNGDEGYRALSNDLFFVWSDDEIEPERPTVYILIIKNFIKKDEKGERECVMYHMYTDEEFLAIDNEGELDKNKMEIMNNGVNLLGFAPFVYINYTRNKLLPIVNHDLLQNNIQINLLYTEGKVANHYQGNPLRWLKNFDKSRSSINIHPSAWLMINGDENSQIQPEIGQLESGLSHADSIAMIDKMEKTLSFLAGVNLSGFVDNKSNVSGDALIMLGQDILEDRKEQISIFKPKAEEFINMCAKFHNKLIELGKNKGPNFNQAKFSEDFECEIIFPTPDTAAEQKDGQDNPDGEDAVQPNAGDKPTPSESDKPEDKPVNKDE